MLVFCLIHFLFYLIFVVMGLFVLKWQQWGLLSLRSWETCSITSEMLNMILGLDVSWRSVYCYWISIGLHLHKTAVILNDGKDIPCKESIGSGVS